MWDYPSPFLAPFAPSLVWTSQTGPIADLDPVWDKAVHKEKRQPAVECDSEDEKLYYSQSSAEPSIICCQTL